jgi:hypothetical protein
MVQKIAGQTGAHSKLMFSKQFSAGIARSQIKRILVAHVAGDAELQHQRFQAGDRGKAGAIGARRPLEAIGLSQFGQRTVDLPQQHRRAGGGAAAPGQFAIDDGDIQALTCQPLADQRSGNAGADDKCIAFDVLADFAADRLSGDRKPRRTAAAQIGLLGIVWIENADNKTSDAGAKYRGARLRLIVLTETIRCCSEWRNAVP